ncbi:chromosome segregation protein SMC [Gorillibacterium massiliense]|uniref:chromosome segregation protein SMC n=1 Tax=Gorillibacterium massiliense TaxID=1280390 RepID=UPI0004B63784|nr:chromosome segregation protein SMC [Gorillibacterium massiliense]
MFLKRLELAGFKSFADKTELEFVQGITAVVGPNGSGKSNISDGIRWVLGETSAKSLRGGKMEDVIFAGSDARKAVNYGEVSLTLDNSDQALSLDFNEVTVTRRVHRSGDSEYLINKQPCRLKDITELFMDTGIGKEAYSIIGQGRIEEILSTKSEDRRGIFEEASGIVKYKSRKKEAEKRLAETEQNLLRIHDLVSELEDQLEPLKEQSEKAIRYKELRENLKQSEISLYVYQIEQLHSQWSQADQRLKELKSRQLELSAIVGRHDAALEKHRWETRRLDEDLERLHSLLLQVSEDAEKCEGQGEVLKERSRNLTANRSQLELAVSGQAQRLSEQEVELTSYREKLAAVTERLAEYEEALRAEEIRLLGVAGGTSSEAEEKLKGQLLDTLNEMAQTRNDIRYAEQQIEQLTKRSERLDEEQDKWSDRMKDLAKRYEELTEKRAAAAAEVEHIRDEYAGLSRAVREKQAAAEEAGQTLRKWEQRMDSLVSRQETMQEMQNDYDGFQHGVKEVLKAKNRPGTLRGIHGAVAELVKVPADVELAVETALGAALQNIVVDSEADGRAAIAFLKQRQLGRATFLPLDVIRGRNIAENELRTIRGQDGFVGVAAELVGFEEAYRQIVYSLLGHVIISKTLEDANRIAARCQYRYRVVTLEGDIVNPGGSMTGGSQHKKTASLLGRQRQIDELEKDIAETRKTIAELKSRSEKLRAELAVHGERLEQLRLLGEEKRVEEQQYAAELGPLEKETKMAEDTLSVSSQDRDSLEQEITDYARKQAALRTALAKLTTQEQDLQQAIRAAELARKASESEKEELQTQLTDLKVKTASAAQEKMSTAEQLARFQSDYDHLHAEMEKNNRQLRQLEREKETNDLDVLRQVEQLNNLRIKQQEYTEQNEFKRAERAEWLARLEAEENETREQRNDLKQVEEETHKTEVQANRMDVELDNLLKKLSEEYELSFELAKARYPVPDDISAVQAEVRDLRRSITALGEVNLGAIEEYERISERYTFLDGQKADLTEAKATLYQVIREMDEEMSKRFRTTFDAIRSQFVVVFAKLFGGGRADLILSDPANALDTGIEIVAQPPGKKLQNLQLLSGGERALTAIALLFAILRIKPVPFCVLDEVEAALDEANVSRFAEYLREFSGVTQFIVVTHRKGTMEEADVLYGVTMEEGGVSKLVSVRLEEEEAVVSA